MPDAFPQHVQELLPFLVTVHGSRGVPFVLSLLLQVLDPLEYSGARREGSHVSIACRLLAEVPDAFPQRVQKLLPFLMTVHGGQGVPFVLPLLLQVLDPAEGSSDESQTAWLHALTEDQVVHFKASSTAQHVTDKPLMKVLHCTLSIAHECMPALCQAWLCDSMVIV